MQCKIFVNPFNLILFLTLNLIGGAVIRMMQHFLTETVFQTGLQKYLDK